MEVNRELPNLADGLDESVHLLAPGGPRARARVPLARGPHREGALRRLGRGRREPIPCPASRPSPDRNRLVRLLTRRPLRPPSDEVAAEPARPERAAACGREAGVDDRALGSRPPVASRPTRSGWRTAPGARRDRSTPRTHCCASPFRARRARGHRRTLAGILVAVPSSRCLTIVAFHVSSAQSQLTLDRLDARPPSAQRRYETSRLEHASLVGARRAIVERAADARPRPAARARRRRSRRWQETSRRRRMGRPSTLRGWTEVKPTLADRAVILGAVRARRLASRAAEHQRRRRVPRDDDAGRARATTVGDGHVPAPTRRRASRPRREHDSVHARRAPHRRRARAPRARLIALLVGVLVVYAALGARLVDLQAREGRRYRAPRAEPARPDASPSPAERGGIFDRNGDDLALSVARARRSSPTRA